MKDVKAIEEVDMSRDSTNYTEAPEFKVLSLENFVDGHKDNMTRPHRHSFYQILWFTDCFGTHFVDFDPYGIEPNTIFFVAKGQIHYFDDSVPRGHMIHFNDSFLNNISRKPDSCLLYDVFIRLNHEPYVRPVGEDLARLAELMALMNAEYPVRSAFGENNEILRHLVSIFLLLAKRIRWLSENSKPARPASGAYLFLRFRALLEERFKESHSVRDYAATLGTSGKKLANCCKSTAGRSSEEIIRDRVLLEAKRLLFHSDMTVQEVAYHLGFRDPYYFTRFFKKNAGCAPREFKQRFH
jgi:AraC family transcriptional regulator, transcriptional activator of pobA